MDKIICPVTLTGDRISPELIMCGYAGNYGIYRLRLQPGEGWEGLDVRVTWETAGEPVVTWPDADGKYAHIVGNGSSSSARSNAHTLDWSGNAWYAGTVEGTAVIVKSSTEGSTKRFKITVDDSGTISATEV